MRGRNADIHQHGSHQKEVSSGQAVNPCGLILISSREKNRDSLSPDQCGPRDFTRHAEVGPPRTPPKTTIKDYLLNQKGKPGT